MVGGVKIIETSMSEPLTSLFNVEFCLFVSLYVCTVHHAVYAYTPNYTQKLENYTYTLLS